MLVLKQIGYLFQKINVFILVLYLTVVWGSYLFLFVTDNTTFFILFFILGEIGIYLIAKMLLKRCKTIKASDNYTTPNLQQRIIAYIIFFLITFATMMIWYIGYYPGAFSPDSVSQYEQAITGDYNDWHPVWHTICFFTFPLKITGGWTGAIILFQMLYFSLAMAYMCMVIYKHYGKHAAITASAFVLLNPYTGSILLFPWKDVAFAISTLIATVMITEIYLSGEKWLTEWKCALLGIVLANATLFRHNAVLYSAFMLLALFFHVSKKNWIILVTTLVVFLIAVKGPVYYSLHVDAPDNRISEIMGLPLTVIGNVAKESPGAMDEEIKEFAYSIASPEEWQEKYICGNFNSIKWKGANLTVVNESSIWKIIKITLKCFVSAPKASLRAFFSLTDLVYGIENGLEMDASPGIVQNNYEIEFKGNHNITEFLQKYKSLMTQSLFKYCWNVGFTILVILILILAKNDLSKYQDWKRIFLYLPIFTYDFGTMLLLTGSDNRFFFVNYLVCPLLICVAFKRESL